MSFTLLVHLQTQHTNTARLNVARDLADRFDAVVLGTAACDPRPPACFEGTYPVDTILTDRTFAQEQLDLAEAGFRHAFKGRENSIEWRSAFVHPNAHVERLCRCADLVITGRSSSELLPDPNSHLDLGGLVMRAGRPVMVVPENFPPRFQSSTIVVGWKDSREARRAIHDALPLALLSQKVLVTSVVEPREEADAAHAGVADVIAWFRRHGIQAEDRSQALTSTPASQLRALAFDEGADLIITGAYGHGRTREWMLGGVTHDLLAASAQCLLMSH